MRTLNGMLFIAAAVMLLATLPGCATVQAKAPKCADINVMILPNRPEQLVERFRQLQQGECRLPVNDRPMDAKDV